MALDIIQKIINSKAFVFEVKPTDFQIEGISGELIDIHNLIEQKDS